MMSPAVRSQRADVSLVVLAPAILSSWVCSSSGAFLQHPPFGTYKLWRAEQSPARVSWINDCCDDIQALISYGEIKQTSYGIPPPTCYMVVQLISRANACRRFEIYTVYIKWRYIKLFLSFSFLLVYLMWNSWSHFVCKCCCSVALTVASAITGQT